MDCTACGSSDTADLAGFPGGHMGPWSRYRSRVTRSDSASVASCGPDPDFSNVPRGHIGLPVGQPYDARHAAPGSRMCPPPTPTGTVPVGGFRTIEWTRAASASAPATLFQKIKIQGGVNCSRPPSPALAACWRSVVYAARISSLVHARELHTVRYRSHYRESGAILQEVRSPQERAGVA